MKRYQAKPSWELERSLRRAALRRGALIVVCAAWLVALIIVFLTFLFTS